jgi:hypothetical protein
MRWLRGDCGGCDSLDIAALWPVSASVAGLALPELSSERRNREQRLIEAKKETL